MSWFDSNFVNDDDNGAQPRMTENRGVVPAAEQQGTEAEEGGDVFAFENDARAGNWKEQQDAIGETAAAGNEPIVVDPQSMGVKVGEVQTALPSGKIEAPAVGGGEDAWSKLLSEGFDPEQAVGPKSVENVGVGTAGGERQETDDDEEVLENAVPSRVEQKRNRVSVDGLGGNTAGGLGGFLYNKQQEVAQPRTAENRGEGEPEAAAGGVYDGISTWDELQKRLEELDAADEKRRRKSNWWELMTNALVGGANIYGTTKGAPALDLKTSEAYDKAEKDAYERLKDRRSQEMTFVQKRIEEIQKNREYERKLAVDEANINYKEQQLAIKDREVTARIKNMEDKVAAAKELQEWKEEVQRQKDQLTAERNEIARERNRIAWYNAQHKGGKGGSSSGASSKTLVSPDGKSVVFKSTDWIGMAKSARASSYECKTIAKAKEYLRTHIKEAREAKLIEE